MSVQSACISQINSCMGYGLSHFKSDYIGSLQNIKDEVQKNEELKTIYNDVINAKSSNQLSIENMSQQEKMNLCFAQLDISDERKKWQEQQLLIRPQMCKEQCKTDLPEKYKQMENGLQTCITDCDSLDNTIDEFNMADCSGLKNGMAITSLKEF